MLSPANLDLPTNPGEYAAHPVPSIEEWRSLWTAWDIVTKSMVPREELLSKPIKLRNALIFYLGHIPTFLGQYADKRDCFIVLTSNRYSLDSCNAE
jgi:hypothetical protein